MAVVWPAPTREQTEAAILRLQEACQWFTDPNVPPMAGVVEGRPISDAKIAAVIESINRDLAKEARNRRLLPYDLRELPADRQRALVEQIELIVALPDVTATVPTT